MEQDRYPLTYRALQVRQVISWIKAGQSGCIVGLRGGGISNVLHFLLLEEAHQQYLKEDYDDFAFILIDLLALTECTEWAVCELILDRLLAHFHSHGIKEDTSREMASLQREVIRSRNLFSAYRAVERCMDILCRPPSQRIVLLFSEFDEVFRTLDPSLFRCLRAIRNAHKGQVCYVVAVTNELARLRNDLAEVEHFYQLVSRNVCYLGPFCEAETRHMIHYLSVRRPVGLGEEDTARLVELSGGHPGLLKAILSLLWNAHQEGNLEELAATLKDERAVQAECQKVWESLSASEQSALYALVAGAQVAPNILCRLKHRGVVRAGQLGSLIFSPLFAHFVSQRPRPSTQSTLVSRDPPIVQIDGQLVENLTELEFEMLCYLYEHWGRVCTKDELIADIYHQKYERMKGGVTDEALQKLVSRLRSKIEPAERPRYIVTVRGEGYKFVDPDGQ